MIICAHFQKITLVSFDFSIVAYVVLITFARLGQSIVPHLQN